MVTLRDVVKRFGDKTVLDGISLDVAQGEILAIMGASGGGKTTLLRCVSGLIKPDEGTVEVGGVNVLAQPELARRKMGLVFQSGALFDSLTVKDNILFGVKRSQKVSRKEMDALVEELLDTVGLSGSENPLPSELSGGMRKRVALARALALRPEVMLYDEPITGLDPITAYTIDALIADVRKKFSVTSLVVSHDVSSVYRVADRIAFLDAGKLAFLGAPKDFGESQYPAIRELVDKASAKTILDTSESR